MKIEEVTCFALRNNGTLLIKTEVDEPDESYRYCFYIYKGSETLYKSPYDRKSFLMWKADAFGKYQIKAFVRNSDGAEKDSMVISYVVNRSNARELDTEDEDQAPVNINVSVEKLKEGVLMATASGDLPEGAQFAWYVYPAESREPEFKGNYSTNPMLTYSVKGSGNYYAKVFVKSGARKDTARSEEITM